MGRGSHTESFAHARRPLSACRTLVRPVGLPIKTEEGLQLAQDAPPCGVGALYATDTTHSVDQGNQFPSVFLHRKDETTSLWLIRGGQLKLREALTSTRGTRSRSHHPSGFDCPTSRTQWRPASRLQRRFRCGTCVRQRDWMCSRK